MYPFNFPGVKDAVENGLNKVSFSDLVNMAKTVHNSACLKEADDFCLMRLHKLRINTYERFVKKGNEDNWDMFDSVWNYYQLTTNIEKEVLCDKCTENIYKYFKTESKGALKEFTDKHLKVELKDIGRYVDLCVLNNADKSSVLSDSGAISNKLGGSFFALVLAALAFWTM